jgi:SAM-dependent methyltransferase
MPFEDASFDAVAGDGSFNSLPSLNAYGPAFRQIARVLRSNGALVLRFFLRPDRPEAPEVLVAQARTGAFPTTASFRLRFAMSLAGVDGSVELSALHRRFNALVSDRDELARATGWPRADIDRVDVDAGSKVRFTFPTLAALEALARPVFRIARMERGTYTQAEHCPTILFLRA